MNNENTELPERLIRMAEKLKEFWELETIQETYKKIFSIALKEATEETEEIEKLPAWIRKSKEVITELLKEHPDKIISLMEIINKIEIKFGKDERTVKKYIEKIIEVLAKFDVTFIDFDNSIWSKEKKEDKENIREDYKQIYN